MKKLRLNSQARKAFQGSSRGFTLIEVLVALALFGIIAIAFLGGLATASRAVFIADERTTAESLARSQLEYVKNQDYIYYSKPAHDDYHLIGLGEEGSKGYTVKVEVEPIDPETGEAYDEGEGVFDGDDGIQKITVIVSHDDKVVITLEGYKVDR